MDDRRIRGVLFDSGDVLIRPIGGRRNPRYDFEDVVLAHHPELGIERYFAGFVISEVLGCIKPTERRSRARARAQRSLRRRPAGGVNDRLLLGHWTTGRWRPTGRQGPA